jgi:hypothetical protein
MWTCNAMEEGEKVYYGELRNRELGNKEKKAYFKDLLYFKHDHFHVCPPFFALLIQSPEHAHLQAFA